MKAKALTLQKERGPSRRNWTRRWFVIEGNQLAYYKDAAHAVRRDKERGRIDLRSFVVRGSLPDESTSSTGAKCCVITSRTSSTEPVGVLRKAIVCIYADRWFARAALGS